LENLIFHSNPRFGGGRFGAFGPTPNGGGPFEIWKKKKGGWGGKINPKNFLGHRYLFLFFSFSLQGDFFPKTNPRETKKQFYGEKPDFLAPADLTPMKPKTDFASTKLSLNILKTERAPGTFCAEGERGGTTKKKKKNTKKTGVFPGDP